jgi:hypothetical protein
MLNFDTRAGEPLFQIYGRAAGTASASGTALLNILADGNVGIGTTSPDSLLEVSGADESQIKMTGASGVEAVMRASASTVTIGSNTSHNLYLRTGNSARMTIDTSGNVGIGLTAQSTNKLEVFGNIQVNAGYGKGFLLNDNNKITRENGGMAFTTNSSERWRFNSSGHFTPAQQHTYDIGGVNSEVRNIYAQGLYVGGSGSANKLDDYEEGTWTPTSGVSLTIHTTCRYTKIGNHLTVTFDMTFASSSSGDSVSLNSIPFSYHSYNSGFNGWQNTNLSGPVMWHVAGTSAAAYNGKTNAVITYADVSGKRIIGTITGIVA